MQRLGLIHSHVSLNYEIIYFHLIHPFGYHHLAHEYQMKIAAYTGWRYEYVEASWPDTLHVVTLTRP